MSGDQTCSFCCACPHNCRTVIVPIAFAQGTGGGRRAHQRSHVQIVDAMIRSNGRRRTPDATLPDRRRRLEACNK
jgi:hypothetical protein